jgi:hypothetical protein
MSGRPDDPSPGESTRHGLSELIAERRAKGERLRAGDAAAFPYAFENVEPIAGVLAAHEQLQAGEETEERHRVAAGQGARRSSTSSIAAARSSCTDAATCSARTRSRG